MILFEEKKIVPNEFAMIINVNIGSMVFAGAGDIVLNGIEYECNQENIASAADGVIRLLFTRKSPFK